MILNINYLVFGYIMDVEDNYIQVTRLITDDCVCFDLNIQKTLNIIHNSMVVCVVEGLDYPSFEDACITNHRGDYYIENIEEYYLSEVIMSYSEFIDSHIAYGTTRCTAEIYKNIKNDIEKHTHSYILPI